MEKSPTTYFGTYAKVKSKFGAYTKMENETNVSCNFKKPIHVAVQNRDIEEIEALTKSGVEINQLENGQTPLHLAIIFGETLAARKLISLGANLRTRNKNGFTPLHVAVLSDDVSLTDLLIDRDFYNDIDTFDENGNTALHIAVLFGKVNTVRTLFIKGANADLPNKEGHTSLHIAIIQENSDVLDVVLKYVGKPNILDKKDFRPLHLAVLHNRIDAIRKIGRLKGIKVNYLDGNGNNALHLAAKVGNLKAINELSVLGVNVNFKNPKGYAPIHLAVLHNKLEAIETLVHYGAQIDSVDGLRNTPVHLAATQNNILALKLLIHLGANIKLRNDHGDTPLHAAVMADSSLGVRVLLNGSANFHNSNIYGMTPLHLAACMCNKDIITMLVQYGLSVHFSDVDGNRPLHLAATFCNSIAIETLINNGANLDLRNEYDLTPMDIIMQYVKKDTYKAATIKVTDLYKKWNLMRKYPFSASEILKSAKTILKFEILTNFENSILNEPGYVSNILTILQNYINDCFAEVNLMNSFPFPACSFYQYVKSGMHRSMASNDVYTKTPSAFELFKSETVLNHILDISTTKGYPIYRDIIVRKILRHSLLNKVERLRICTRYNGNVLLNSDASKTIAKCLGNEDILNLLLVAYSDSDLEISAVERNLPELKTTQLALLQKSIKRIRYSSVNFSERTSSSIITRSKKAAIGEKGFIQNVKSLKNLEKTSKKKYVSVAAKSTKTKRALPSTKIIKGNHITLSTKVSRKKYISSVKTAKEKGPASSSRTRKGKSYPLGSKPSRKKLSSTNLKSKKKKY